MSDITLNSADQIEHCEDYFDSFFYYRGFLDPGFLQALRQLENGIIVEHTLLELEYGRNKLTPSLDLHIKILHIEPILLIIDKSIGIDIEPLALRRRMPRRRSRWRWGPSRTMEIPWVPILGVRDYLGRALLGCVLLGEVGRGVRVVCGHVGVWGRYGGLLNYYFCVVAVEICVDLDYALCYFENILEILIKISSTLDKLSIFFPQNRKSMIILLFFPFVHPTTFLFMPDIYE